MPSLTAQEVFDKVAVHLLTQKKRSTDEYGHCMYRGPEGLKCAAGVLIPDELFNPRWEEHPIKDLIYSHDSLSYLVPHDELINDLQVLHDSSSPDLWAIELHDIAIAHGVSPEVIKNHG